MRLRLGSALLLLIGMLVGLRLPAQEILEEAVAGPQADIDEAVRNAMGQQNLVGVAVGTVVDGEIDYLKGYGLQDREAEIPVRSRKTMFRWASLSKSLTAILAVQLAGQGLLDLDQPISRYLEGYRPPASYLRKCDDTSQNGGESEASLPCRDGLRRIPLKDEERKITTRQLLGHLGGIMHYENGLGSPLPPQEKANDPQFNHGFAWALDYFTSKPLVAIPGSEFHYTTFGYNLAGAVVEKAGGRSLADQLQERIARPLGLSTLQPDYEWKEIPDRAVGYQRRGFAIFRQGSDDVSWKLPGGGFISTVEDLAGYCRGLVSHDFLTDQQKALLWTSQKTSEGKETGYGMGFGIRTENGRMLVSHSGSQQKTKTFLLAVPQEKNCIVVMSNSVHANPGKIASELLKVLDQRK